MRKMKIFTRFLCEQWMNKSKTVKLYSDKIYCFSNINKENSVVNSKNMHYYQYLRHDLDEMSHKKSYSEI